MLRIGREVADGLAAAHAHGLIHRDIKPANIWLELVSGRVVSGAQAEIHDPPLTNHHSPLTRVKILDFGLARMAGEDAHLTGPGFILGTPAYMAPEQARASADVDARCDLFSLGCLLYHLCTGRVPFQGAEALAILHAVANEKPVPPGELNPEIPAPLADLILRLLAKDPADRPPSARAVAEALAILERQPGRTDLNLGFTHIFAEG